MEVKIYLNETTYRYEEVGEEVSLADYSLAFTYDEKAPTVSISHLLRQIYRKFNVDHPEGYENRSLSIGDLIMLDKGAVYAVTGGDFKKVQYNLNETITSALLERMDADEARGVMRRYERSVYEKQDRWEPIIDVVRLMCGDVKYCPGSIRFLEMLMSWSDEHGLP